MNETDTNRRVTMGMIDYIADCIDRFLTEQNLGSVDEDLPLGYTFSFPVLQSKVTKHRQYHLQYDTKGKPLD